MTLPHEEGNAIARTRLFLRSLITPSMTPGVPKRIRKQAYNLMRHYPSRFNTECLIKAEYGEKAAEGLADMEDEWEFMEIQALQRKEDAKKAKAFKTMLEVPLEDSD